MANTTNFGWATPDDTDLVKDGAAAIRTLGSSIDTSFVDLKGGSTNQVLAKNSDTDLDFKWVADASGIPATIFDAKGDLIAATAADTAARLASSGVNGDILTVDTSTATGLKWAASQSLPPFLVATVSQYFISSDDAWGSQAGFQQNQVQYVPVYLPAATYDRIAIRSGASHSGTSTVRLGLYNAGSDGKPSTVVFDAGTVAVNAASTNFEITINQTISAGYYYLAGVNQSANNTFIAYGSGDSPPSVRIGTGLNANYFTGFHQTGVSGAFATATNLVASADIFGMAIRIA